VVTQRERERTTDFAEGEFRKYLDANDLAPALVCTSSFVHMRLKTLLAFRLKRDGDDWKRIHDNLDISFRGAVNLCEILGLIRGKTSEELRRLWKKRNQAAHETNLWRDMSEREKEEARHLCESAISFLRRTDEEGTSEESSCA
jgi:hypothetical protein